MLVYCVVSNIPTSFHSSDLRSFFSRFTESKNFHCFHYKHRPEIRPGVDINNDSEASAVETCCCVIRLDESHSKELLRVYSGKHWVDRQGVYLKLRVRISRLRLTDDKKSECGVSASSEEATLQSSDVEKLAELKPPNLMPQGNVGTPTAHFLKLIQACRFPPRLIGHLGLVFNRSHGKRKYGAVPLDYSRLEQSDESEGEIEEGVGDGQAIKQASVSDSSNCQTAHGHLIRDDLSSVDPRDSKSAAGDDDDDDLEVLCGVYGYLIV